MGVFMMRRLWAIVVALAGIISTSAASSVDFSRLDSLIAEQSHIIDRKEAHLSQLKERLSRETAPADRYGTIKQLYEEYAAYQYDSAYAYVSQCLALARQMNDDRLLNESRLDLAHILSTACLMDQARLLLGQIVYLAAGYNFRRAYEMKISDSDGSSAHGAGLSLGAGLQLERFKLQIGYGKYHVSASSLLINISYAL